jgi:hypothetical protein
MCEAEDVQGANSTEERTRSYNAGENVDVTRFLPQRQERPDALFYFLICCESTWVRDLNFFPANGLPNYP